MKKQSNKKQSNGQNTKLYKAHAELGNREWGSKKREYYTILKNKEGKEFVEDFTGNSTIEAKLHFQGVANTFGLLFDGKVRAYN
jgi:hypothetical protein